MEPEGSGAKSVQNRLQRHGPETDRSVRELPGQTQLHPPGPADHRERGRGEILPSGRYQQRSDTDPGQLFSGGPRRAEAAQRPVWRVCRGGNQMWVGLKKQLLSFVFQLFFIWQFHFLVSLPALAKVTLTLPRGPSSFELLSPNYPDSFPDDDLMEWYFHVPDQHKTAVRLFNVTQPSCLKKETVVEYHSKGRAAPGRSLTDPRVEQRWGDFSMTLRNCKMERRQADSPGLRLKVQVSTSSARALGLYLICSLSSCLALGSWVVLL